ncbi:Gfo/Idh/MocA family oxidoreductase [bacterium]|nr:Gfo/Idh/MocA family oxidoreductase [bacterium]
MKFLVVGCGSMGKRRIRCLRANGESDIIGFDTRADRRDEVQQQFGVTASARFEEALQQQPDALVISVPPALHLRYCLAASRHGLPWFSELPLAISMDGIPELLREVATRKIVGAVGNQNLFHPYPQQLRQLVQGGPLGPVLTIAYEYGCWLPDWHPHEDYRSFYAARNELGGGGLDLIAQEIGWIGWIVGSPVRSVMSVSAKRSSLELDVPDTRDLVLEFQDGTTGSFHFDLIQRPGGRTLKLVAEAGTALWDSQPARVYLAAKGAWENLAAPTYKEYEEVYIAEISRFLACVRGEATWENDLAAAADMVRLLDAVRRSEQEQRRVALEEIT